MTSRLALCAAVAATVVLAPGVGASAQTYEVIPLVPGSAFHGLEGPVGLVSGAKGDVYVTEAFAGQLSRVGSNGEKPSSPRI